MCEKIATGEGRVKIWCLGDSGSLKSKNTKDLVVEKTGLKERLCGLMWIVIWGWGG